MSIQINIFLIILAFLISLEKVAFSAIRKRDREAGLILNDRSYTLFGTLRMIFLDQEKRIQKETEESFADFLERNGRSKKELRLYSACYCFVLFSLGIFIMLNQGMTSLVMMNFCLVIVGVCFFITKSTGLLVLILLYGVISSVLAVSYGAYVQTTAFMAGVVIFAKFAGIRRVYRKQRSSGAASFGSSDA